ncbi:hypothetical protein K9O30_06215 [Clostridium bowmanii]|uniref:hypothetical protein n=1 Tax=Clostridium bowmanii TaxID=132925 RepID=UPI001C0D148E|nr:hypothetical protein [Clostridium bowmanii]MBU3188754.1 hypothetical protein [Clostridium bowmanii]MCA1073339.1 hypothetical protein [Clostridium bowmanii]
MDHNQDSGTLYSMLSGYTHLKTKSISQSDLGGLFLPEFTDEAFLKLVISIIDMTNVLYEIISMPFLVKYRDFC